MDLTKVRIEQGDPKWVIRLKHAILETVAEIDTRFTVVEGVNEQQDEPIEVGDPVNAVAATKVLTVGGTPAEGDTVTAGGKVYKCRRDVLGVGTNASKLLSLNSNPIEGDTFTIGTTTYKIRRDTLGAGVAASSILTSDETAPTDGDTVTVGTRVYRLKTVPSQANDIAISTAEVTMTRIFKAINGTGIAGSDYFAGTAVPDVAVTAVNTSAFVVTVTANAVGFAGNLFAKAENSTHLDWDGAGATFTGGIDAQAANDIYVSSSGTDATLNNFVIAITTGYSAGVTGTGTVANSLVSAVKSSTSSMTVTAAALGFVGNTIAISETFDDGASVWFGGATFLTGGIDPEAANDVYCTSAETSIDNLVGAIIDNGTPGTDYGTLTEANTIVTAAKINASTMSVTNLIKGIVGNDTVIAKSGTNLTWAGGAVKLSGGVNGTVGTNPTQYVATNGDKLYMLVADNTVNDANWRSITLTTI